MQSILFLDFDGPLFSDRDIEHHPENAYNDLTLKLYREACREHGDSFGASALSYWKMDEVSVNMLNKLFKKYQFTTVISSTWRTLFCKSSIKELFFLNDLDLTLHEKWCTDNERRHLSEDMYSDRLSQIERWLQRHAPTNSKYAILDDPLSGTRLATPSLVEQTSIKIENVVIVDPLVGMELKHFRMLDRIFSSN